MAELITYFPEKLTKDSLVIINYFGDLNSSENIYIEYFYDEESESFRKAELSKVTDYSFVLITLEEANNLYFRFVDEQGNIDDNNGNLFHKEIDGANSGYQEPSSLLSEYKKSNNNSNIVNQSSIEDFEDYYEEDYTTNQTMALVAIDEKHLVRRGLRFSYKLNKRIKLLLIKLFRKLPSFLTGNYRRRINL